MPHVAVDEHCQPIFSDDYVGPTENVACVQPIAQAPCMESTSQGELGFRVLVSDRCHHSRSSRLVTPRHPSSSVISALSAASASNFLATSGFSASTASHSTLRSSSPSPHP